MGRTCSGGGEKKKGVALDKADESDDDARMNTQQPNASRYFVVPAPGHYGDRATVISSHRTLAAAKKAAGPGYVVRMGAVKKGDEFLRADEQFHPIATK